MSAVRYRVKSKIADGGMAEIFLARQIGAEGFEKPVVLKRILPAFANDPPFVRMFLDEAHIASTLNHSNIVQILDLGKAAGQYFLALELVDGWSLEQVRKRAKAARMKMPLPVALYVVSSLCRALAFAHTRTVGGRPTGLVHRDVSPQNVLLSREGEVKLTDFGIARAAGRREKSVTGVIKGKISYMSPEQAGGGDLDARSDVFSVGTVLYLLTVGKKPFVGANDVEVLLDIRKGRYAKPSAEVRGFNADVERVIARALRVDRERRWPSAEKMADRIDTILTKLGQPTGAKALKKWLLALSERDGVPPLTEAERPTDTSATVELGSADIQLQEVSPPRREPAVRTDATAASSGATDRATRPDRPRHGAAPARSTRVRRGVLVLLVVLAILVAAFFLAQSVLWP
jgi:eukaryotic-like serine/threonine-protein kinase